MLEAAVLHVVIMNATVSEVSAYINVHFHLWISAIGQRVHMWSWMRHIVWKQRTFVEISSLVNALFSGRIELDHHRAIHFGTRDIHCCRINVIQSHHSSGGMSMSLRRTTTIY